MPHGERRCLGLLGLFDVDALDVQIRVRVAMHELARRRPDVELRLFAPFGATRPIPVSADLALEPLAPLTGARRAALASELTALVVVGSIDLDADTAYGAHPAVDPRDVAAVVEFLGAPPATSPSGRDPSAPHPGLLARRVWPYSVCEQRREFLRAMHWWPQRGAATVVAVSDVDRSQVDALTARLRDRDVTIIASGAGDDEVGAALAAHLGDRAHHIPAVSSSIEDRVAACAGAAAVVSDDATVLALADAYGRPRRTFDGQRATKRSPATVGRDEAKLDQCYDELAALIPGDVVSPVAAAEISALRSALEAQGVRVAHERVVLADYVRAVRNNAAQEISALRAELARRPLRRVRDALRRGRG